jgi:hypothetical protein
MLMAVAPVFMKKDTKKPSPLVHGKKVYVMILSVIPLLKFFILNPSWPHRTRLKENFRCLPTIPQQPAPVKHFLGIRSD